MSKQDSIKIVAVGDGAVGKTCIFMSYLHNAFPAEYVPTIYDTTTVNVSVNGNPITMELNDTAGGEDYDRLRPIWIYPGADIFLVCYSITNPNSYNNVERKWIPEISYYCPNTPYILVGTKLDLRDDPEQIERFKERGYGEQITTYKKGTELAAHIRAVWYCECSSRRQVGLTEVFDSAIRCVLYPSIANRKKQGFSLSKFLNFNIKTIGPPKKVEPGKQELVISNLPATTVPIYGHTSALYRGNLYCMGGTNENGEHITTISKFDLRKSEWSNMEGMEFPAIQFHTAVTMDNLVYIFGGKSNGYRNDCYLLNLDDKQLKKIDTTGLAPSPRYGHSAVIYCNKMYIFGGYDNLSMVCNDLTSLDLETFAWEKIEPTGNRPESRFMHSAVVYRKAMYIFGGKLDSETLGDVFAFDFASGIWTEVKKKPKQTPRFGHSAITTPIGMYVYGGYNKEKEKALSDVLFLDFATRTWHTPPTYGNIPALFHHSCVGRNEVTGTSIYIIGGKDAESMAHASSYVLSVPEVFFNILPDTLIDQIIGYLSFAEIDKLLIASKQSYLILKNEKIWESFCKIHLPHAIMEGVKSFYTFFHENITVPIKCERKYI